MTLWTEFLNDYRLQHPRLTYREAQKEAKGPYKEWKLSQERKKNKPKVIYGDCKELAIKYAKKKERLIEAEKLMKRWMIANQ